MLAGLESARQTASLALSSCRRAPAETPPPAGRLAGMTTTRTSLTILHQNIITRLLLYYGVLAVVAIALWQLLPPGLHQQLSEAISPLVGAVGVVNQRAPSAKDLLASGQGITLPPHSVLLLSSIAGIMALLLALPVSWVYMFTRQKKGYSQSVVHSLLLLPIVVAMVAALVRNSVALAFSLAGVVAAVRFRTTLEDSKDAVYVFAVTALGLACGVQLEVGAVLSVLWCIVILVLWYTDFARVPPDLEGIRAEQSMQRALSIANRTSQFVARLDREILDSMAPAQLEALQSRVEKRKAELEDEKKGKKKGRTQEMESPEDTGPRFDGRMTIVVSDPDQAQPVIESLFEAQLKRWKMIRLDREEGQSKIVYAVRPKKGVAIETVAAAVEREGAPFVASTEVERWT
jgi:hypothetical protein